MKFKLPYGDGFLDWEAEDRLIDGVLESSIQNLSPPQDQHSIVRDALAHPTAGPPLHELARGKRSVVIICSDHTRPVPSRILIPLLLEEIRRGNREAEVTLLIASGCHREMTDGECREKFGDSIVDSLPIVVHDCHSGSVVDLGRLPSGGPLLVNEVAVKADLLIAEGFIEPHISAGFSGGRKSVLPGVASYRSVLSVHSGPILSHPNTRTGLLEGNPVHQDMLWAANAAGLAFICNVVLNGDKQIVHAVAGEPEAAHRAGCAYLKQKCAVPPCPADIVVATNGGYPLDQNLYQAVKGMTAAEATVRKDGVIVMVAESRDGHGSEDFYRMFLEEPDPGKLFRRFQSASLEETQVDQWEAQILARILLHACVVYVSRLPEETVRAFGMIPAGSVEEAVETAQSLLGTPRAKITVIPDGVAVVVSPG